MSWDARPTNVSGRLLAYSIALAVFLLVPPLLHGQVGPASGFTLQETVDLLTPLVVIPLAWWILDGTRPLRGRALVLFLVIAAVWIEAQGIHLAANAIGDTLPAGPEREAFYATPPGALDHWLDEVLSHRLWHFAWIALSFMMLALAVFAGQRSEPASRSGPTLPALAGAIQGATFFFVTTEGETWPLGVVASVILLGWAASERLRGSRHPIVVFTVASAAVTLLGYAIWAVRFGWPLAEPCSIIGC